MFLLLFVDFFWFVEFVVGEFVQYCFYFFGILLDGLLCLNVDDLVQLLWFYIGCGEIDGVCLFQEVMVIDVLMFKYFGWVFCWDFSNIEEGENFWNYLGGDFGVVMLIVFCFEQCSGFILFFNDLDFGEVFGGMIQMVIGMLNECG